MLKFRVTRIVPPGNRYFYDIDGVEFESASLRGLESIIRNHCRMSDIEIPADLKAVIVDYMCRRLPEDFCHGDLDGAPRARTATMNEIKAVTMAKAASCSRAQPAEVKRRAVICANCKRNDRSLCPTCVGLTAWAQRLIGGTLGAREEWLGVCTVDATSLAALVHLNDENPEGELPDGCWRKK